MKKAKASWRSLVAAGLVSATLALPLRHATAGQQQPYLPFSPYAQQEQDAQERPSRGWWIIPVVIVGCLVFDCLNGSGGGQESGSVPDGQGMWRGEESPPKRESPPAGDPPGTCYWGDTTMGTCVN